MTEHKINKWEEELEAEASLMAAALPSAATEFFSIKNATLFYKGQAVPNNKMEVVILDFLRENQYYRGVYDPNAYAPPVCYAYGNDDKTMVPHPASPEPQSSSCATCPHNQFGSAGKGKACKNILWLGMTPVAALESPDRVADAEVAKLKLSPTNVKYFGTYGQQVAAVLKRPAFGVVTEVSVHPDPKTQYRIAFKTIEVIADGSTIEALMTKRKTVVLTTEHTANAVAQPAAAADTPNPASRFGRSPKM